MQELEQTLDSREVAEMVNKEHKYLIRDIRNYMRILTSAKISPVDFFKESTYKDAKGEERPCYRITKKGCEFIGHKIRGEKGTLFTARYINRFHEMQEILSKQEPELPWFIKKFSGHYIVLERDFISITGVDIRGRKPFYQEGYFIAGTDWNGYGQKCNSEGFREKYGFDYGEDDCMIYFYLSGVIKALRILMNDRKANMNPNACELLRSGISTVLRPKIQKINQGSIEAGRKKEDRGLKSPVQINIMVANDGLRLLDKSIITGGRY